MKSSTMTQLKGTGRRNSPARFSVASWLLWLNPQDCHRRQCFRSPTVREGQLALADARASDTDLASNQNGRELKYLLAPADFAFISDYLPGVAALAGVALAFAAGD
jgi:hypothetical protein